VAKATSITSGTLTMIIELFGAWLCGIAQFSTVNNHWSSPIPLTMKERTTSNVV
jgi:hypothetical protein